MRKSFLHKCNGKLYQVGFRPCGMKSEDRHFSMREKFSSYKGLRMLYFVGFHHICSRCYWRSWARDRQAADPEGHADHSPCSRSLCCGGLQHCWLGRMCGDVDSMEDEPGCHPIWTGLLYALFMTSWCCYRNMCCQEAHHCSRLSKEMSVGLRLSLLQSKAGTAVGTQHQSHLHALQGCALQSIHLSIQDSECTHFFSGHRK